MTVPPKVDEARPRADILTSDVSALEALAAGIMTGEATDATSDVETEIDDAIPGLDDHGSDRATPTLRSTLRRHGVLPLGVLTALNFVDEFDRFALITLAPEIRDHFGLSDAALGGIAGIGGLVTVLAAMPFGVLADRARRVPLVALPALLWAVFAGATGLVRNTAQLVGARLLAGVGKGSIEPVHTSLLADYYPAEARGQILAVHRSANPLGGVIAPLLAGAIATLAGGAAGWRWAFFASVPLTVLAAIAALALREPKRGGQESWAEAVSAVSEEEPDFPKVPLATATRRLLQIQSLKYMYAGIGVLGFGFVGAPVLIGLYLEEVWNLAEAGRGIFFSIGAVGPLLGLPIGGKLGDRFFRHDPAWPLYMLGVALPTWAVILVGSLYLPTLPLVTAGWVLAGIIFGVATPAFLQVVAATAPPQFRALAFALFGIFLYVFGGFFGPVVMGAASDAWGPQAGLSLLIFPGVLAGLLLVRGARYVRGDIKMVVEDVVQLQESQERERLQTSSNLVELRGIDFYYGQTQVLFGVDLDVPEGEIVALLGTNGAGKSTVLRALTGLGHPRRGQIRFRGQDITYLETEQLLDLGIAQMPGGKAIFPALTVDENLRVGAFSFRKDRDRFEADLALTHARFPILKQRGNQLASTLSGGEQQMLALSKALMTRPTLLCIDELSLGLAPSVIADLLEIVREIHARGTTIVIVEQSVNVALSLATSAVFMEKGQVRYAGPAEALHGRSDLLRSVFLDGEEG